MTDDIDTLLDDADLDQDPPMRIDIHVHARDLEQRHKATVEDTLALAWKQGIRIVGVMPNTNPPILTESDVDNYLSLAPMPFNEMMYVWIGGTDDVGQLVQAACIAEDHPRVLGIKAFFGKSVGNLALVRPHQHRFFWEVLSNYGYEGVVAGHCEAEEFMDPSLFNPDEPKTHTLARPSKAERASIKSQLSHIKESGFKGHFHVCHTSDPESVHDVYTAKQEGMRVSCGVTPHHIMWDDRRYGWQDGNQFKMNPPLRNRHQVESLRVYMRMGRVDMIETDHAPHAKYEKEGTNPMSGYPTLQIYRHCVEEFLPHIGVDPEVITAMTSTNIQRIFAHKLGSSE